MTATENVGLRRLIFQCADDGSIGRKSLPPSPSPPPFFFRIAAWLKAEGRRGIGPSTDCIGIFPLPLPPFPFFPFPA